MNENEMLSEMLSATCFSQEELLREWSGLNYDQKQIAYTLFANSWDDALYCIEDAPDDRIGVFSANGTLCHSPKTGIAVVMPYDF